MHVKRNLQCSAQVQVFCFYFFLSFFFFCSFSPWPLRNSMLVTTAISTGIRRNQDPERREIFLMGYSCTFKRVDGPLPSSTSFFVLLPLGPEYGCSYGSAWRSRVTKALTFRCFEETQDTGEITGKRTQESYLVTPRLTSKHVWKPI